MPTHTFTTRKECITKHQQPDRPELASSWGKFVASLHPCRGFSFPCPLGRMWRFFRICIHLPRLFFCFSDTMRGNTYTYAAHTHQPSQKATHPFPLPHLSSSPQCRSFDRSIECFFILYSYIFSLLLPPPLISYSASLPLQYLLFLPFLHHLLHRRLHLLQPFQQPRPWTPKVNPHMILGSKITPVRDSHLGFFHEKGCRIHPLW